MGRISRFFKPKPKEKPKKLIKTSWWYYIFLIALLITTSWLVLLWPEQISALYFELWLLILQFLHTPINFQMWWFLIFVFIDAWVGWLTVPVIEIPSTKERKLYVRTWEEGGLRYFKLVNGLTYLMSKKKVVNRGLRWTVIAEVSRTPQGSYVVYQTKNLEVNQEIMWQRVAESLIEELKKYRAEKERKETTLTLDELIDLEKARHGRGGEE
ncbi:hypothetical protein AciM339_0220 [Aciduliprofundum sp. MAR08-339]|uniref:hypothetical protein n=1 Tax=Aciduliprofundum sp. (strain MAR08-339) TaxID=673860 RepID=UPI0002A4828D|nr:hypothetical protein AciM339_0188 [Aciduliprofundum sp. MAR08-339]AGB04117.1 hypothetical protein AciM339_0220 [Aciduliprofundum sp. MAR08-339]